MYDEFEKAEIITLNALKISREIDNQLGIGINLRLLGVIYLGTDQNKAIEYLSAWKLNKINDTQLLHSLRYVAYGYNNSGEDKRPYDNIDVIWPGNLTTKHKPKLVFQNGDINYTLYFYFDSSETNNPTEHFST